jgi:hypothetical protein
MRTVARPLISPREASPGSLEGTGDGPGRWWDRPGVVVPALTGLGLVHVLVVAGRYHVGSFGDDAAYLYMARNIVGGTGLFGHLANGYPLVSDYPPGYPYLLAPLVWAFGGVFWAERALSVACYVAVYPLTWVLVRRCGVGRSAAYATLALLALNPVLGTYGSMIMAECPFLVVFLGLVMVAERWGTRRGGVGTGAATVLLAAGAVWLKEAGLAMAAGVVLYLCWQRRWARAAVAAVTIAALLAPIAGARMATSTPLAGARYANEIGGYLSGSVLHQLAVIPMGFFQFLFYALYAAVMPVNSPFSDHLGVLVVVAGLASASAAVFCPVGAITWWRRRGADVVVWVVGAYFLMCIAYRYVNERRVVLFLPIALVWYVTGAGVSARWLARVAARRGWASRAWRWQLAAVAAAGAVLAVQFPGDYRVPFGHDTSKPGGSPYMALLAHLGNRRSVVETDFVWTTALFTGHPGATSAFQATYGRCSAAAALAGVRRDGAAFGYTAAMNAKFVDDPCLTLLAGRQPWAVTLLHTGWDDATVFELVGPGTGHPLLRKLAWSGGRSAPSRRGSATMRWVLPPGSSVTQVSLGGAGDVGGGTRSVVVSLDTPAGWRSVAAARGAVGRTTPFMVARIPEGVAATAVAVTVAGRGTARVSDLAVVGRRRPVPAPRRRP